MKITWIWRHLWPALCSACIYCNHTCCLWWNLLSPGQVTPFCTCILPQKEKDLARAVEVCHQYQTDPSCMAANACLPVGPARRLNPTQRRRLLLPHSTAGWLWNNKMRFGPVKWKTFVTLFFFWNSHSLFFPKYATETSCTQFSLQCFLNKL